MTDRQIIVPTSVNVLLTKILQMLCRNWAHGNYLKLIAGGIFHCMFSIAGVIDYKPAVEIRLCLFMLKIGVGCNFLEADCV